MISKSKSLQVIGGGPVFYQYGVYTLDPSKGFRQFNLSDVSSSDNNRAYNLKKAEKVLGVKCEWVDGPDVEYMNA